MAEELPRLGLLVDIDPNRQLFSLLKALRRWCRPQVAEPEEAMAAWLLSSPRAPGAEKVLSGEAPVAIWVSSAAEADEVRALGVPVVAVVTSEPELVSDERAVLYPDGIDARRFLPMTPFVRARWRAHLGLPARLVVGVDVLDGDDLPDDLVPTALALASAVAVRGSVLLAALAWGAACATDADTAEACAARHGV